MSFPVLKFSNKSLYDVEVEFLVSKNNVVLTNSSYLEQLCP